MSSDDQQPLIRFLFPASGCRIFKPQFIQERRPFGHRHFLAFSTFGAGNLYTIEKRFAGSPTLRPIRPLRHHRPKIFSSPLAPFLGGFFYFNHHDLK
jgi:hypothetical protein